MSTTLVDEIKKEINLYKDSEYRKKQCENEFIVIANKFILDLVWRITESLKRGEEKYRIYIPRSDDSISCSKYENGVIPENWKTFIELAARQNIKIKIMQIESFKSPLYGLFIDYNDFIINNEQSPNEQSPNEQSPNEQSPEKKFTESSYRTSALTNTSEKKETIKTLNVSPNSDFKTKLLPIKFQTLLNVAVVFYFLYCSVFYFLK